MPLLWIILALIVLAAVAGSIVHAREKRSWPFRERRRFRGDPVLGMQQALQFYADGSHWKRRHYRGRHWELPLAMEDRGARARRALMGLPIPQDPPRAPEARP